MPTEVTERLMSYVHPDTETEAFIDLTYSVPDGIDPDQLTQEQESLCDLVRVHIVNATPIPILFTMVNRSGKNWQKRTMQPGTEWNDTAPFPTGIKKLSDLREWRYQPNPPA